MAYSGHRPSGVFLIAGLCEEQGVDGGLWSFTLLPAGNSNFWKLLNLSRRRMREKNPSPGAGCTYFPYPVWGATGLAGDCVAVLYA